MSNYAVYIIVNHCNDLKIYAIVIIYNERTMITGFNKLFRLVNKHFFLFSTHSLSLSLINQPEIIEKRYQSYRERRNG